MDYMVTAPVSIHICGSVCCCPPLLGLWAGQQSLHAVVSSCPLSPKPYSLPGD